MRGAVGILGRGDIASALTSLGSDCADLGFEVLAGLGPAEIAARAGVIIVDVDAVKVPGVLESLRPLVSGQVTVVSAVWGISLRDLRDRLGDAPGVVRVCAGPMTREGSVVTVLTAEQGAPPQSLAAVSRIFERLGVVDAVAEDVFEVAAAVVRSGAAFLATALEGMEDGAVEAGLPRDTARAFVRQTALTTALLLRDHQGSPADLKDQVASPAGTTIAGLGVLEDRAVRGAYIRAMRRASGKHPTAHHGGGSPVIE